MVHSTTEGHKAYRKTRKEAKKLALGEAQTEANERNTQVLVRWHHKDGEAAGDRLVYPSDTPADEKVR